MVGAVPAVTWSRSQCSEGTKCGDPGTRCSLEKPVPGPGPFPPADPGSGARRGAALPLADSLALPAVQRRTPGALFYLLKEPKRESTRQCSEPRNTVLWWGGDTDRACHRPQFESNLRHDRVSWPLVCPTSHGSRAVRVRVPTCSRRALARAVCRPLLPGRAVFARGIWFSDRSTTSDEETVRPSFVTDEGCLPDRSEGRSIVPRPDVKVREFPSEED